MRLKQAVFVARDLETRAAEVCAALGLEIAHRDPFVRRWGVENAIMPVGTDILEIISPLREGTAAGRFIERRGGDGGYMVILQVDDAAAVHRRVVGMGVRAVELDTSIPNHTFAHFHPSDLAGVLLSVETAKPPPGVPPEQFWPPAGLDWVRHIRRDTVDALAGVELEVTDPGAAAALWSRALDRVAEPTSNGTRIAIDNGDIRFVAAPPGRAPGIRAYDVRVATGARARLAGRTREVCGCLVNYV
jgi:hypothetical protein